MNSVCQIQLYFIPSPVAGIRGQTFIRQASELPNCIPKTTEQKYLSMTLFWGETQTPSIFPCKLYWNICYCYSHQNSSSRTAAMEEQDILRDPLLNNTINFIYSIRICAILRNTKFPESAGFKSKATSIPAQFCCRLTGNNSPGLLKCLQMGQPGSRGYRWSPSYPVSVNSLLWSHLVQKPEETLKIIFAELYGNVCWPTCIYFNENSVSRSHNIFSWQDPAHKREGISLKQCLPSEESWQTSDEAFSL